MKRNCLVAAFVAIMLLGSAANTMAQGRSFRGGGGLSYGGGGWHGGDWHHHDHGCNSSFFFGVPFFGFGYPYGWGYPYGFGGGYYGYAPGYYGGGYGSYYGASFHPGSGYANSGSSVARLQQRLAHAGYYHGAIDGVMGPRTRAALRAFQHDNGNDNREAMMGQPY